MVARKRKSKSRSLSRAPKTKKRTGKSSGGGRTRVGPSGNKQVFKDGKWKSAARVAQGKKLWKNMDQTTKDKFLKNRFVKGSSKKRRNSTAK